MQFFPALVLFFQQFFAFEFYSVAYFFSMNNFIFELVWNHV